MALRVLLVGLVASLGLELPSGPDLASLARSGQVWVDGRMAELSKLRSEAEEAGACLLDVGCDGSPPSTTEVASTRADLIFEASVEQMASGFAVDLASMGPATPAKEAVVKVERAEEMPPALPTGPQGEVEAPLAASSVVAPSTEASSMASKLSAAVQLTREAVDAWASLIQAIPVKVAGDDLGDSP